MRKCFLMLAIALVAAFGAVAQWTPEKQIGLKLPGSPQISPDGRMIAYTINEAVMTADKSEYLTHVWVANTDGSGTFRLTYGDKSATSPKWSPDGTWIAFLSNRKDNRNNVYLIRAGGGEAEQLTDVKGGIANFDWSPDGKWIAFTMTDPKSDDEEKNDKARNDFRWVDENPRMSRLFTISVARDADGKREPRRLTAENRVVTGFDWSPDGTRIVYAHTATSVANDWPTSDISVVNVADGKVSALVNSKNAESAPRYSPDGKWISFTISDNRWAQSQHLAIVPAVGGATRQLAPSPDGQPVVVDWSADGKSIWFTEARGTKTGLYAHDVSADRITHSSETVGVFSASMNASRTMIAMVWQNAALAPEIYVSPIAMIKPVRISNANAEFANLPVPKTEVIKWKSSDGREIEGLLTYPIGYKAGTRVPMILNIHGGPAGVFQEAFIGSRGVYPLAVFASRGYAVLRPNPRGSSGYGVEFRRANFKDWGGMDYQDLMTGVDTVVSMGVADENRLGVMGWSYGGYMTSRIVTMSKRFKAASAGAPVTNLMSFNGTTDILDFVPDYFGGDFWNDIETYRKHSAMFNIKGVTTPTMIQHGEADVRVPISQGFEFYYALKRQGVPTRMIVLPRQPHGPTEPRMQIAAMQSNLDWFEKYIPVK